MSRLKNSLGRYTTECAPSNSLGKEAFQMQQLGLASNAQLQQYEQMNSSRRDLCALNVEKSSVTR